MAQKISLDTVRAYNPRDKWLAIFLVITVIVLTILSPTLWNSLFPPPVATQQFPEENSQPTANYQEPEFTSGQQLTWEQALELLNSGEVESAFQTHDLEVTFRLKNGVSVYAIEPEIDAVFAAIEMCAETCENVAIATE